MFLCHNSIVFQFKQLLKVIHDIIQQNMCMFPVFTKSRWALKVVVKV